MTKFLLSPVPFGGSPIHDQGIHFGRVYASRGLQCLSAVRPFTTAGNLTFCAATCKQG